jgi:DNA-binding transcriptional LysR family regulator
VDLLQLEHFLAVVEEHTFTRAAERVCRSQPAVSQSIKKLEQELGTALFSRTLHEVTLTESGRVLADYARRMVTTRNDAVRELAALKGSTAGTLTIAAHESAAIYLLPGPLRNYFHCFPNVKVGILRIRLAQIPRQVMDGEIHVGFVKEEPSFRELQCIEVHTDEMILVATPRHPLASRREVRIGDLGQEPFVVHHLCSTTEEKILRLFEQHTTRCRIVAELWSFENIKSFVQAGVGLAIVPRVTVSQELAAGTLVHIPLAELNIPRRTLMIYREHGYLSDSARELIKMVCAFNWPTPVPLPRTGGPRRIAPARLEAVAPAYDALKVKPLHRQTRG